LSGSASTCLSYGLTLTTAEIEKVAYRRGLPDDLTSQPRERYAEPNDNVVRRIQLTAFDDQLTEVLPHMSSIGVEFCPFTASVIPFGFRRLPDERPYAIHAP
jgi:hypothetical protein